MEKFDNYRSCLSTRYASKDMQFLFSEKFKITQWRKLWINLAKSQKVTSGSFFDNFFLNKF